jgi:hypothetical protein
MKSFRNGKHRSPKTAGDYREDARRVRALAERINTSLEIRKSLEETAAIYDRLAKRAEEEAARLDHSN